jgi:hypothetical protein
LKRYFRRLVVINEFIFFEEVLSNLCKLFLYYICAICVPKTYVVKGSQIKITYNSDSIRNSMAAVVKGSQIKITYNPTFPTPSTLYGRKRNMKPVFLTLLVCLLTSTFDAQVTLPYYSGFDSAAERNGWTIYRLGESAIGNWSIANVGGYSGPSCISHDYSPSSGVTVVDDWYVSPGFLLSAVGTLDSVRYAFSGFSVPTTGDTIGVYLILGDQDPATASSIIELAEFRDANYQADNEYRLLTGITLPQTNEMAYIGIRYRNAEASSRWLYVRFDNVAISESTTSMNIPTGLHQCVIYPNPTTDDLTILHKETGGLVSVYDQRGIRLCQYPLRQGETSTMLSFRELPQGIYRLSIQEEHICKSATVTRI